MSNLNAIPAGEHFAILTQTSVTIPGDERSRTNPGHGYPEHTDYYISYQAFTDRAEWEKAILWATRYGRPFRALVVTPAQVTPTVSVVVAPRLASGAP